MTTSNELNCTYLWRFRFDISIDHNFHGFSNVWPSSANTFSGDLEILVYISWKYTITNHKMHYMLSVAITHFTWTLFSKMYCILMFLQFHRSFVKITTKAFVSLAVIVDSWHVSGSILSKSVLFNTESPYAWSSAFVFRTVGHSRHTKVSCVSMWSFK